MPCRGTPWRMSHAKRALPVGWATRLRAHALEAEAKRALECHPKWHPSPLGLALHAVQESSSIVSVVRTRHHSITVSDAQASGGLTGGSPHAVFSLSSALLTTHAGPAAYRRAGGCDDEANVHRWGHWPCSSRSCWASAQARARGRRNPRHLQTSSPGQADSRLLFGPTAETLPRGRGIHRRVRADAAVRADRRHG